MKTLLVYAHLLAACVSVGILLLQDLALAKTRGNPLSEKAIADLRKAADIMFIALVILWVTGLTLVIVGYLENPQQYLMNPKLWAKFTVVSILTLNGLLLHYFSFPRVISRAGLLGRSFLEQNLIAITGAVSSTSWLFACFLGIARPWNYTANYEFVMLVYAVLVAGAIVVACNVIRGLRIQEPPLLTDRVQLQPSHRLK
ncbi:MAG TPA: DUF2214 domain-containing protein [Cellvibrio sp.]|nr:DUF2214 domain-containing protein [Cellvibrio sp.]